jgi:hypothetical protein
MAGNKIEETWRADAAEQRVCELQQQNATMRDMLEKVYNATNDCQCNPSDETLAIWHEIRKILNP